jgi:cytochrome bd ubiquinol oxidase subunit I
MHFDVVLLSRIQFALTIMFHYIFPPLTIGLGLLMVLIETMYMRTRDPVYKMMALFWTKVFAVNFAIGVATGIVMEFQFGTNWATYSRFVGDVFGSALAAEGIFAFFLESGFLAILVFGWDKVSARMHYLATCMVSLGSIFSSIWIVIANSWQQTPAGYHIVKTAEGFWRAEITDFWAMVFNPSSVTRLFHVWFASFILGALFACSISAFYILKKKHLEFAERTFKIALIYGAFFSYAELASGHFQADKVAETQPAKLAALEAHFKTGTGGSGMYIIGIPDVKDEDVKFGIEIPNMLSFLVYQDPNKPVPGLDQFPRQDRPPIVIPFFAYHLMVALGMSFIGLTSTGLFFMKRGTLFKQRWLLWIFVLAVLGGYAANECGWVACEVGRQPWLVYGLLRTKDAVSKSVAGDMVLASILMFGFVYSFLFVIWVSVLTDKIVKGPEKLEEIEEQLPIPQDNVSFWKFAGEILKKGLYSLTPESNVPIQARDKTDDVATEERDKTDDV